MAFFFVFAAILFTGILVLFFLEVRNAWAYVYVCAGAFVSGCLVQALATHPKFW